MKDVAPGPVSHLSSATLSLHSHPTLSPAALSLLWQERLKGDVKEEVQAKISHVETAMAVKVNTLWRPLTYP